MFSRGFYVGIAILLSGLVCRIHAETVRTIPQPLPTHPGNIFVFGENVVVPAPPGEVTTWRMMDYSDKVIAKGEIKDGRVDLGQLPVGYYKIVRGAGGQITNRTWIGVVEQLRAPTPRTSPIAIDVAMAWFFPNSEEKMRQVSSLCQLAGINRVRDRLMWGELEPKRGTFAGETRYDISARIQKEAGLEVLQVTHISPEWANPIGKRFPPDLRDFYTFYREMARRWKGEVPAFEPWNEADIAVFGGHTGSEMASFQKAAYLGLKAGNPDVTACMNVFAIRRADTLADFHENQAGAYFDTYNLHHYEPLENYPGVYAAHRAVSEGRPMWTTECSVHIKWHGDERFKELTEADLRLQSERVTKTYAMALHEGPDAVFYFMLPHYTEYKLQYGLLRPDLTPRPGYLALAAVGRLLADAKPLGRLKTTNDAVAGYLFDAKPDGQRANVLVMWATNDASFNLPGAPIACFDHLGRRQVEGTKIGLTAAPIYAVLPLGTKLDVIAAPKPPSTSREKPGFVVLQALVPDSDVVLTNSAYKLTAGETKTVPVFVYNFGEKNLRGNLNVAVPEGWTANVPRDVEIAPGERKELTMTVLCPKAESWAEARRVRISGDFGRSEKPILSLHFVAAQ